ncbi:NRDE family protein [Orrella sp. 11846]|uniref:NRDE family protein n=1 Tax=Orrella sp. 11846 TaxID=3409913 RepID=UPI003B5B1928
MCLAVLALPSSSAWSWAVVANRDEEHARPSLEMQPWEDNPQILAGRDLQAGGTWLGVRTDGRLALLTNVREPGRFQTQAPSRGHLVEGFLKNSQTPADYLKGLQASANEYNGFNLLVGHNADWHYASNRANQWQQAVTPGFHGLSNALLDTPWPKLVRTRQAVTDVLTQTPQRVPTTSSIQTLLHSLAKIMQDDAPAPDVDLPQTGVGLERERLLSSPFIRSDLYGTRCTTVVLQERNGPIYALEISYLPSGQMHGQRLWTSTPDQIWTPWSGES